MLPAAEAFAYDDSGVLHGGVLGELGWQGAGVRRSILESIAVRCRLARDAPRG